MWSLISLLIVNDVNAVSLTIQNCIKFYISQQHSFDSSITLILHSGRLSRFNMEILHHFRIICNENSWFRDKYGSKRIQSECSKTNQSACRIVCLTYIADLAAIFTLYKRDWISRQILVGLGERCSVRPKTNLVQFRAVRKPLVAILLSILKCMFHSKSIKILQKWDGSNGKINMQAVPLSKVGRL